MSATIAANAQPETIVNLVSASAVAEPAPAVVVTDALGTATVAAAPVTLAPVGPVTASAPVVQEISAVSGVAAIPPVEAVTAVADLSGILPGLQKILTEAVTTYVASARVNAATVATSVQTASADVKNAVVSGLMTHLATVEAHAKAVLTALGSDLGLVEPKTVLAPESPVVAAATPAVDKLEAALTPVEKAVAKELHTLATDLASTAPVSNAESFVTREITSLKADVAVVKNKLDIVGHPGYTLAGLTGLTTIGGGLGWLIHKLWGG
jgi:hypothetical protein